MLSLSDGDVSGMWMVVSGKAALFSAPVVLAALATHLATGENFIFSYFILFLFFDFDHKSRLGAHVARHPTPTPPHPHPLCTSGAGSTCHTLSSR